MKELLKSYILPASVFVTGACVLVVEIAATRVLSPFYGNTIFTVSSIITVILAALSVGYYVGGKLADKQPKVFLFFSIISASGILLLAMHLLGIFLLPVLGVFLSLSQGPLISSLLLFFLPALLLGTLSPYAIKLQSLNFPEQGIGTVSGNIFFWSTLGSIAGSLSAGFLLIPFFGVDQIIIGTGVVLFLLGFVGLLVATNKPSKCHSQLDWESRNKQSTHTLDSRFRGNDREEGGNDSEKSGEKKLLILVLVFVVLLPISLFSFYTVKANVLYSKDGVYEKIIIYDGFYKGRPTRFFQQDKSLSGAMFLDEENPSDLVYEYTKYYSLYKILSLNVKNALVIGGGAYSVPKALLYELPEARVDVSEIEPELESLAKTYFELKDSSRLKTYIEDGRRLLKNSQKNYDLIFSDVYYSLFSIPPHFTTKEFFELTESRLTENGIFIANVIGGLTRQQPSFLMSEIKTFKSVFKNSYFFAVESPNTTTPQNIIFVGYNGKENIDFSAFELTKGKLINLDRFDLSPYPVLTDNYAPVEYLVGQSLKRAMGHQDFNGQEILALVDQQVRFGPRYPTAKGHKKVQDFILAEMKAMAGEVKTQTWIHSESNGDSYELKNIIARFEPQKTERIILATHYDSQKISFNNFLDKSQASPGANNSASGTAVLLELARLLNNSEKPEIGIDIVFFDGEEGEESQGADFTNWKPLGSAYFIEHLKEIYPNKKPISGLVLDMVCDRDLKFLIEPSSEKYAPLQTSVFWEIGSKIDGGVFSNKKSQEIRDDHTLLNEAGIPSFLVIDFNYPYWATTKDTPDKCRAKSLEIIERAVWEYIFSL